MKTYNKILFCSLLFLFLALTTVFAAHIIRTSGNTLLFNSNEDVGFIYNISVNVTDVGQNANVTQLNITIPSTFSFISGSNFTTANNNANLTFTNTSTVISWFNFTYSILNGTGGTALRYFSFNATASTPGNYNLTITTLNATGAFTSNISVIINDTTIPSSIAFASNTTSTGTNISGGIYADVTVTDNGVVSALIIELFNSTGRVNITSTTSSSLAINFTGMGDGTYYLNATVNDTYGNTNFTVTRTIVYDRTAPSVTITCTPSSVDTGDSVTCSCSATDATSGADSSTISFTASPDTSQSGTFSQTCTARDFAGNLGTGTSAEYTIEGGGSSSSSSSSGSSTTTAWTVTYPTSSKLENTPLSRSLGSRQRVAVKVGGETHHVGIARISATSAEIEVSSTPQRATMNVGESKKFDVDSDSYYDMKVTLVSIENSKAMVSIEYLHEAIVTENAETQASDNGEMQSGDSYEQETSSLTMWWIAFAILIAVIIIFVVIRARNKKFY